MRQLYLVNQAGESFQTSTRELHDRVINFAECLNVHGRFKVRGTKYIWYREIDGDLTHLRMTAYGGYETGGRGCFYVEVKQ